ncbi:MAG: phosphopantetheine-binding protein [Candidatus Heteroscillospira sp.]|jgi:acyl carrier protein
MDRNSVFDTIKDLIIDITDADDITEETGLVDDLGIDSVDLAELVLASEEEFDLVLPKEKAARESLMEEVRELETVGDMVDYIIRFKEMQA